MNIIAISRCLGSDFEIENHFNFHFRGFFMSEEIKMMSLLDTELCLVGEDYVLQIKVLNCKSGILSGRTKRKKVLNKILIE